MKMTKVLVVLFFIAQNIFVPTANAYEGILHYAWTYYLSLQVGFTERQAYQIASGTNAIDWDPQTNPVASALDTKIDTLFGAERFRYFNKDLNSLWSQLDVKLEDDTDLKYINDKTTLLKLRNVLSDHNPVKMLDGTWQKYYNIMIENNPAVRTWIDLHAFQPIILQNHLNEDSNVSINYGSTKHDLILLKSPLTSVTHNDRGWVFTNSNLTWGLGIGLERPAPGKNNNSSKLDALTFDLFYDTLNLCGKDSIKTCLTYHCNSIKTQASNLVSLQARYASTQANIPQQEMDPLTCYDSISIQSTNSWVKKSNEIRDDVSKKQAAAFDGMSRIGNHEPVVIDRLMSTENIQYIALLEKIRNYQEMTEMSWPLIYSALVQDIQTFVLNNYWDPKSPEKLAKLHGPTIAVNAVRGKAVSQLKTLSEKELNPGPLLHYIQDLHSHGPYNTYNGHALANHVPDFISQKSTDNSINATIDTIIVLCEFKEFLNKTSTKNSKVSSKFFIGQNAVKSKLCKLAAVDKELSGNGELTDSNSELKKYISNQSLTPGKVLEDILTELGNQSNAPWEMFSMVTLQGLQKIVGDPPHSIVSKETTMWSNEIQGLPDFPRAVHYLEDQVNSSLIPVWRNNDLRLEVRAMRHPSNDKPYNNKALLDWKWSPSIIPTGVIQYNYDYCGRVIYGDINWPITDDYLGLGISCEKSVAENTTFNNKLNKYDRAANNIYEVENIAIDIKEFSINYVANGTVFNSILIYDISGIAPGLDGGIDISITKPKNIKLQTEASTDMHTGESEINHGPDHLPILEFCQLLVANTDKVKNELKWILKGNHLVSDKEKAVDMLDKYMLGKNGHNPRGMSNFTMLLKARRYNTSNLSPERASNPLIASNNFTSTNDIPIQQYNESGAEAYLACSVQVQGMPPVVALQRIGLKYKASFGELTQGDPI